MPRYKLLNGVKIQFTAEEEALKNAEEAQEVINKQNLEQEKQDKETKKASAKQKLIDLGLTEEEVKALIGV